MLAPSVTYYISGFVFPVIKTGCGMSPFEDIMSLSPFADTTRDDTQGPELVALLGLLLTRKDAVRLPE